MIQVIGVIATALIHWLCDRVLPRHWPIVVEFHEHHDVPLLTTQMPFVALFANSIYFTPTLAGDRVLEIGSGRGGGLAWLARRDPHRRFV